jgi:hypothetical protein
MVEELMVIYEECLNGDFRSIDILREMCHMLKSFASTTITTTSDTKGYEPISPNKLLAGYLAYEFLTKGTLMGKPFVSSEGQTKEEVNSDDGEEENGNGGEEGEATKAMSSQRPKMKTKMEMYVGIMEMLMSGEIHLQGVVNPTQIARFLDM